VGLYADVLFPRLMDLALRRFGELRAEALAHAHGDVLEIGFGTGLNLPHYPEAVTSITAVDPMDALRRRVERRVAASRAPVRRLVRSGEALPFASATFDCVVTTWTLCTIPHPVDALREMRRVRKPEGLYVFLEHGRSDDPRVARWQRRLNPIQRRIGCGCELDRPIDRLILEAGLEIVRLDRFLAEGLPHVAGEMYRGVAR
jgi:ubiquinone/menaquinone biosynthesis C-methylase UbiE